MVALQIAIALDAQHAASGPVDIDHLLILGPGKGDEILGRLDDGHQLPTPRLGPALLLILIPAQAPRRPLRKHQDQQRHQQGEQQRQAGDDQQILTQGLIPLQRLLQIDLRNQPQIQTVIPAPGPDHRHAAIIPIGLHPHRHRRVMMRLGMARLRRLTQQILHGMGEGWCFQVPGRWVAPHQIAAGIPHMQRILTILAQ